MKKIIFILITSGLLLNVCFFGYAQQNTVYPDEIIKASKSMGSKESQLSYLIHQAKAFYNSKEFQKAADIVQYVLRYLDSDSKEAKDILDKVKEALSRKAKETVSKVSEGLGSKLGSFGR